MSESTETVRFVLKRFFRKNYDVLLEKSQIHGVIHCALAYRVLLNVDD